LLRHIYFQNPPLRNT